MSALQELDRIESLYASDQLMEAFAELQKLTSAARSVPAERDALLDVIAARPPNGYHFFAARLALAGGMLVEAGGAPGPLGRSIIKPIERALLSARRMLPYAADMEEVEGADGIFVGGKRLTRSQVDSLTRTDIEAASAWVSLDTWYRPAVAAWSRDTALLAEVRSDEGFLAALTSVGMSGLGSRWLSILLEVALNAPFVILFPELNEVWSFVADGVSDMGQLTVLASKSLADPLMRIGASAVALPATLATMGGDGPQRSSEGYDSSFHFYPRQSVDPANGMPRDKAFVWHAPGGMGDGSLPADFLPGTLVPMNGARVLVCVGPRAPGRRVIRRIGAARLFGALRARLDHVRQLAAPEAKSWFETVRRDAVTGP